MDVTNVREQPIQNSGLHYQISMQKKKKKQRKHCLEDKSHKTWAIIAMSVCVLSLSAVSDSFCNPVDYSLPGSSVHRIFQARILEWVAISFFRGLSQVRDRTLVSRIAGRLFMGGTRESLEAVSI